MPGGEVQQLLKKFEVLYSKECSLATSLESKIKDKDDEMSILSKKHQVLSEKYKKLEKDYFELKQSEKNSKEAKLLKEIKRLKVENVALTEKSEKFELQLQ